MFSARKPKVHITKVKWGQNVIFSFESPKNVEIKGITWTYVNGGKTRKVVADGKKIKMKSAHPKYYLTVNWVDKSDAGFYNCEVATADGEKLPVSFKLVVLGESKELAYHDMINLHLTILTSFLPCLKTMRIFKYRPYKRVLLEINQCNP